ncbi:phage tail protein, partial [Sinorhizobium meliloti]
MTAPYVTGTVSVTAGSAVVTGTGTAWATALIAGGLFGLDSSNGNPVPILSVDSNTQLTLAKPWRGTTAAGQGYWIVRDTAYLQQQTVNAQALSTYIQRLDNAV